MAKTFEVRLWCEEADPRVEIVTADNAEDALYKFGEILEHDKEYWEDFLKRMLCDAVTKGVYRFEVLERVLVRGRALD